jgi:hypothetical protein
LAPRSLFFDGTQLPYTDTFKYLGMVCNRQINLNFAAVAALRPFMAGIFQSHDCNWLLKMYAILAGIVCKSDLDYLLLTTRQRDG